MMKTTEKRICLAGALLAIGLWVLVLPLPVAAAPEPGMPPRFFIAVMAGYFYPQQGVIREIYDRPLWPFELQLGWNWNRRLSVFAAARYLETSGKTILLATQQPGETYALRWRMGTLRLGLNCWLGSSRLTPFLGAGASYVFYQEKWLEAPLVSEGKKAGFFIQAGGRYRLLRRFQVLAQLEYASVPAVAGAQGTVNLGGLNLSLGLQAGVF